MPSPVEPREPTYHQASGSEYGGVRDTYAGGIQPKNPEDLTNTEILRLGYLVGVENQIDPRNNIEDRRQALGLRPASGKRPEWLVNVSPDNDPRLDSLASIALELGYGDTDDSSTD